MGEAVHASRIRIFRENGSPRSAMMEGFDDATRSKTFTLTDEA